MGHSRIVVLFLSAVMTLLPVLAIATSYDLQTVNGMDAFSGPAAARDLLAKNGFVVSDPSFKQIFEPYIKSPEIEKQSESNPMGRVLPSFITTDSAWHTYHILLEEGVKDLEQIQARRLRKFSRQLLVASQKQKAEASLLAFTSIALALQDAQYRSSLAGDEKQIVNDLLKGSDPVTAPIGFALSPVVFRAQSFYSQSPELSDYFAARQWYASVVFRLENARETKMAVNLSALVSNDPELRELWNQLSDPFTTLLAPSEDGTIPDYNTVAVSVLGTNFEAGAITDSQVTEIQKKLESRLSPPRVSDQLLAPDQYAQFGKYTRGFRMLPPRQLPCAVCFHHTTDPAIPNRRYPSGLDFFAASPALRSPAAIRAVQSQFGKNVADLILKADSGPMPNSLHGEAMQLLAKLQEPLPSDVAPAFRSEAWSDLQLWTQLGAWAEQRHTWALHTKLSVSYMGIISPPQGMVAPYPEFFSGLAKLTRHTAKALQEAGLQQKFDVKTAATDVLDLLNLSQKMSTAKNYAEFEKNSGRLEQFGKFQNWYYEKHKADLPGKPMERYNQMEKDLAELARRCSTTGQANESETEALRTFWDFRADITHSLSDFAPVCDRLAELAAKTLKSQALTEEDGKWIEDYGVTLAGFHFYYGNSYEVPRDDFPIVTRVFLNPLTSSILYAGLARPQALYVIAGTGKSVQLYRGAVMAYREFARPNDQLLDDESWRALIAKGQAPIAPPFTRSFYSERTAANWIKEVGGLLGHEIRQDTRSVDHMREVFNGLAAGANDADVPLLIKLLGQSERSDEEITDSLAAIISQLKWEPHQKELMHLLASSDSLISSHSATILLERPAKLDTSALVSDFDQQPSRARRLYCMLLSSTPQQIPASGKAMLRAAADSDAGLRWQAMVAIGRAQWNGDPPIVALTNALDDSNQYVAAAAASALARLNATNEASRLLFCLQTSLKSPKLSADEAEQQYQTITHDLRETSRPVGGYGGRSRDLLDPDGVIAQMNLNSHITSAGKPGMRRPPGRLRLPTHSYGLPDALIEALADLNYTPAADLLSQMRDGDYEIQAILALRKIAPERVIADLLTTAKDKQIDSYIREHALVNLRDIRATNHVRDLVPLLDDTTPIVYSPPIPGEWRMCDRALETIAIMLGWQDRMRMADMGKDEREQMMIRVREWAKSTE
jgi:HEAT repeat protein